MAIQPEQINRCEDGFWTHNDFPEFDGDEYPPNEKFDKWLQENSIGIRVIWFESDAEESLVDRYFQEDDLTACEEWNPTCESPNAFIISIHDTEDGPVAIFAIPSSEE